MVYGRIAQIAATFARRYSGPAARYTYNILKVQDRIIDKTYRKAGLYNRGTVKGIQHGLIGGQIIGGLLSLGLPGVDDAPFQPSSPNQKYQKRSRYKRYSSRYNKYGSRQRNQRSRRCRPRRYGRSRKRFYS